MPCKHTMVFNTTIRHIAAGVVYWKQKAGSRGGNAAPGIPGREPKGRYTIGELHLSWEWEKTFAKSDKVDHEKITFHNRYGITLAADLYRPSRRCR